ncbi:anti-sigma factor antagonist [Candidatus Sumerlaeota bacterium]|nr:anti-sigma factor antagonist [Candidatus Sumerlaeota bacterium]
MTEIEKNPDGARVVLDGDLDHARVEALRPELTELAARGGLVLTLDFKNVEFMCSSGLGLLVELYHALRKRSGRVVVENMMPHVERLLRETKLLPFFTSPVEVPESERLSALDAVQKQMSRELGFLSLLNTISSNVLQSEITPDTYNMVLDGILSSLRAERGLLLLIDGQEGRDAFRTVAAHGFDDAIAKQVGRVHLEPAAIEGRCLELSHAILFGGEGEEKADDSPLLRVLGARRGLMAPMVGRERPIGLIVVEARADVSAFFSHATPLLQVFANICGLAFEKQSLLEDIQSKNERLSNTISELQRTQHTLMEAGKLAAIGSLVRGLAHALNNRLVPLVGYTEMLAMDVHADKELYEKIEPIVTAANDLRRIVENLRAAARRGDPQFAPHRLSEVIDSALTMLDYLFREERIGIDRACAGSAARANVDRERLVQAFVALFQRLPSAFSGTPDGRQLRIEIESAEKWITIRVIDNGRVIPDEELATILDPFSQEESSFSVDRLNFSIASGILKDHRGSLSVLSSPDLGTCAEMRMPVNLT